MILKALPKYHIYFDIFNYVLNAKVLKAIYNSIYIFGNFCVPMQSQKVCSCIHRQLEIFFFSPENW